MSILESTLAKWSHHEAGTALKHSHVPIRQPLKAHKGLSQFKYEVFLQGSYKNDTNLGGYLLYEPGEARRLRGRQGASRRWFGLPSNSE